MRYEKDYNIKLLLVSIATAFSQQTTTQEKNKDYYLEKSKSKKNNGLDFIRSGNCSSNSWRHWI